ncbi:AraC family transcriptional regulator [Flavobacterium reichenbachii]|uniref:AraC family transcriptional regulator n=1 Tax=Flavobacterium reichenbachii TaxID=362418 RepID=A0A085ZKU9_9FLAO|nr:AraC family transcriptional regulator [Flavobacterium reichenbachii]KFF05063.1 AraC family transcriptional regulator [Flavobacterium reichenbachii]OXB16265.1 AraC family transcriptional regulator [Flavobacterium reichenbachii]
MKHSQRGEFYGETNKTICLEGITLTDTVYTLPKVDWHYHENAYFTFILQGNVIEGNKKEIYNCSAGDLLFHNWQEAHYNIKPDGFTRGFHLEIEKKWLDTISLDIDNLEGSLKISNPDIKLLMYKVFRTSKCHEINTEFTTQTLLFEILSKLQNSNQNNIHKNPKWVKMIDDLLHEQFAENLSLDYLSKTLDIHPVHLSRNFSKYFDCNLSEYVRKLKVEKALSLIALQKQSFTEIAHQCGFSDQSHFIRCFKEINDVNPSEYKKILLQKLM